MTNEVTDASGNVSGATAEVTVSHDQGGAERLPLSMLSELVRYTGKEVAGNIPIFGRLD
jgi:hypothetical protein